MTFENAGRDPFVSLFNLNQINSPKDIMHSDFYVEITIGHPRLKMFLLFNSENYF